VRIDDATSAGEDALGAMSSGALRGLRTQRDRVEAHVLLESKNAIVYGAGGAVGGAVALAFAREGAKLHLAGRTLDRLESVAEEIGAAGGVAETGRVDALDEQAVDEHEHAVAASARTIDISLNREFASRRIRAWMGR